MIRLEIDDLDPTRVRVEYKEYELELVKGVAGVHHKKNRTTYPLSWATWVMASGVFGDMLEVGPVFAQWTRDEYARRVEPCLALRTLTNVDPEGFDPRLFSFQRAGVAFLSMAQRALLGDDMGTGKTITTIMALKRLEEFGHDVFPVLVTAPPTTKFQWEMAWQEWFPGKTVRRVSGTAKERREALESGADVLIMNWESLRLHSRLGHYGGVALRRCKEHKGDIGVKPAQCEAHPKELNEIPFRSIIADEAHIMMNPLSKCTRAMWALGHSDTVAYKFALTGTPISKSPVDLWAIMHFLAPEEYPTMTGYVNRYGKEKFSYANDRREIIGFNEHTKPEFLGFFDPRFRRMPKELVLKDLPPVTYQVREAEMSAKQRKAYKELEKQMFTRTEEGDIIIATNKLSQQIRLLQYASALCSVDEAGDVQMTNHKASPKLDALMEVIEATPKPIAVAAESRKLIELASERLTANKIPHGLIVGGMTEDQRAAVLRDLEFGKIKALLFTMRAGGTGVNMTAADTIVFLERSWSMLIDLQTMARVHRIGSEQHSSVTRVDIIAPGTVEQKQLVAIATKRARLEEITRDKETLRNANELEAVAALENEESDIVRTDIKAEVYDTNSK